MPKDLLVSRIFHRIFDTTGISGFLCLQNPGPVKGSFDWVAV